MPASLTALAAALAVAAAAPVGPPYAEGRLDNGLRVAALRLDTPGQLAVELRVRAGARAEGRAEAGAAELVAGLAWADSPAWPADERERVLAATGWRWGTERVPDALVFRFVGPASGLPTLLALEADRLANVAWSHGVHAAEAAAARAARARRTPLEAARVRATRAALGLPPVPAELPSDVTTRAWWHVRAAPAGTSVVLAGDLDPSGALSAVAEAFEGWRAPAPPAARAAGGRTPPAPSGAPAAWVVAWRLPDPAEGPSALAAARLAAEVLLGRGGLLPTRLAGWADVMVLAAPAPEAAPVLEVLLQPRPGADPAAVREALDAAVAALADPAGVAAEETLSARADALRGAARVALASPEGAAGWAGAWVSRAGSVRAASAFLARLGEVGPEALAEAARRWLSAPVLVAVKSPDAGGPSR